MAKNQTTLPGFDIFGQTLPENDRAVLVKPLYRRKHTAGFVPLWNEFFRCYHLAGVSPTAAYLWAYLRQYEHDKREWNAVADISWPGRRDIADALGISINTVGGLLEELRQAGLVSFQPVLPGFEDLAESLHTSTNEMRQKAAEYGVTPKIDATLYRTADPYTKSEFAIFTRLKFCKECKLYRHCEGAKEARTRLAANSTELPTLPNSKQLNTPETNRIIPDTATVSNWRRSVNQYEDSRRIGNESTTVSNLSQSPTPHRVKTKSNQLNLTNQPESTNPKAGHENMVGEALNDETESRRQRAADRGRNDKKGDISPRLGNLSTVVEQEVPLVPTSLPLSPDLTLLLQFGFNATTAGQLLQIAVQNGKPQNYIAEIIGYSRENAHKNPQGMARRLIERGEERLSKLARWQQQMLPIQESEFSIQNSEVGNDPSLLESQEDISPMANEQVKLSKKKALVAEVTDTQPPALNLQSWWQDILGKIEQKGFRTATEILRHSSIVQQDKDNITLQFRNAFEQRRAEDYKSQLEVALLHATGQLYNLQYIKYCSVVD